MTYKQAYDKIINAYFKDEIKPMDRSFCFCGTLCSNPTWSDSDYSQDELKEMENALLYPLMGIYTARVYPQHEKKFYWTWAWARDAPLTPEYEEALFKGMCAALDILKMIHNERGEIVDDAPQLEKRIIIA